MSSKGKDGNNRKTQQKGGAQRRPGAAHTPNKAAGKQKSGFGRAIEWSGSHLWTITVAFFALSFAARLFASFWTGPMVQTTYPDDIRFFDIARSLAEHGEILVRGVPTTFQKILYSLFITPAFMLTDGQLAQMNIIRAINCLLVSSTVFPVALLAKKLTPNRAVALISLLVTVTLPDMAYSATFLSEVLYMPLCVWVIYFACCAFAEERPPRRLAYFAALGAAAYLVYLTKEVGAAFMVAAYLLLVADAARDRQRLGPNALSAAALSATFFGLFLALKLTLFQGMGNTYALDTNDHLTLAALSSPSVFFYLAYSAAVLFVAAILSFYAAPAFLAARGFSGMDEKNRKTFLFAALSFLVMIAAVAYTLSIREDLGEPIPRLHTRYIAPFIIPLIMQCFDSLLAKSESAPGKLFSKAFPAVIAVFCAAFIVLIPRGSETGYILDHYTLKSTFPVEPFMVDLGPVQVNILFTLFKLSLAALTVFCAYMVIKKKSRGPVVATLICAVLIVNAYDNFMSYASLRRLKTADFSMADSFDPSASHLQLAFSRESKQFSYDIVDSVISTNDRLKSLDGNVIVFMHPDFAPYTDTYLGSRAFPVQPGDLYRIAAENGGQVRLADQPIWEGNRYNSGYLEIDTWKRGILTADYIVTLADDPPFLNVEQVYEDWPFVILRNLDPEVIYVEL